MTLFSARSTILSTVLMSVAIVTIGPGHAENNAKILYKQQL